MSMFGIGGGGAAGSPSGSINPAQIDVAVAELEMITDVFNRLVSWVGYCAFADIPAHALFLQFMPREVYQPAIFRTRPEQGRERLRGPLCRKVLRRQQEGRRTNAGYGYSGPANRFFRWKWSMRVLFAALRWKYGFKDMSKNPNVTHRLHLYSAAYPTRHGDFLTQPSTTSTLCLNTASSINHRQSI
jgi:hypothetical protein